MHKLAIYNCRIHFDVYHGFVCLTFDCHLLLPEGQEVQQVCSHLNLHSNVFIVHLQVRSSPQQLITIVTCKPS
jgi:hypothetical protein